MTVRKIGRRFFLLGAGGFALAIPALPSLLRGGRAEAQTMTPPKRFFMMSNGHGGVWQENFWPAESMASTAFDVGMGIHQGHHGTLTPTTMGSDTVLSSVLRAPSSQLTPSLVAKMNLLRGLDVPFYIAHNHAALGNYGDLSAGNGGSTTLANQMTADQVMARSSAVYESSPRKRTIYLGGSGQFSSTSVEPDGVGGFQGLPSENSTTSLFDAIYAPTTGMPPPTRRTVNDRVLESFRQLQSGAHGPGARLGTEDRQRLQSYMDRLAELEAGMHGTTSAACHDLASPLSFNGTLNGYVSPDDPNSYGRYYSAYIDVIVAAFICDSSRIAILDSPDTWLDIAALQADPNFSHDGATDNNSSNDPNRGWHNIAHAAANGDAGAEAVMQVSHRSFFQRVFMDALTKLDGVVEADGSRMLDNTLLYWTQESGASTHDNDSTPVVMAGAAGGFFSTGHYVDYRDRTSPTPGDGTGPNRNRRRGVMYQQWLTTCLDAMGVPRAEWQPADRASFSPRMDAPGWSAVQWPAVDRLEQLCDNPLPIITG